MYTSVSPAAEYTKSGKIIVGALLPFLIWSSNTFWDFAHTLLTLLLPFFIRLDLYHISESLADFCLGKVLLSLMKEKILLL